MRFLPFLDFLSLLVYLYLAVSIFIKNPKSPLNRVCSGLLLCFAIWSLEETFAHNPMVSKDIIRLTSNIGSLGWISFSGFFLWFSLIFTENKKILKIKLFYFTIFIVPLILIYKVWTASFVADFIKEPYGWEHVFANSVWTYLFYFYYVASTIISLYLIFAFGKRVESKRKRKQAKIIFNTALIALLGGTLTDVILPGMQVHNFPSIGSLITLVWAFGIAYSRIKYKFLTITPATAVENIMSTMPGSLILLDRDGEIVRVNKVLQDLLGYRMDEIKGQSADILFGKEALKDILDKCIKEGQYKNYELFFKVKSGLDIPIDLSASVLKDEEKEIIGIVCIAIDTTERKKVDEALVKSEERFRLAAQSCTDLIYEWDIGNKIEWFGNLDEILGYAPGEFPRTFEAWVNIIHLEDRNRVTVAIKNHLGKNEPYDVEYRVRKKDGNYNYWWARGMASRDEEGNPYRWLGVITDITERKDAEEKIRHAAEEWRVTFDSISDFVSLHDKDFKIIRTNKAFADVFKMKYQEIIGKTCYELFHGSREPHLRCPYKQVMQTKKPISVEFFESRLGIYLEITCSPIFDQIGEVIATVHLAKDISSRKEMEKREHLAKLGGLVADMAHEVNNPLMIISGNAQLCLMEEMQSDTVKNNLKIIVEECRRAKNIIQRLLKFSRPSKGEIKEVDINKSIEAVVGIVEHQFKLVNVEIKRNYPETLPLISVDEQQMQEVFMNLINNAVEAMPGGGVITITTSLEGDFLRLDFKDTGSGMSEEVKKKALEPFFTTKEKGTGLGLAVCYGIIKVHNGELKFESELNKGTTVTILLPLGGGKA